MFQKRLSSCPPRWGWVFILLSQVTVTRMHSSRMRTGRALTVSGGGGSVHPRRNFLGENKLKKKKKKNFRPPQKFGSDCPPPKLYQTPPPKNLGQTPPRKFGSDTLPKIWSRHPPRKFGSDTPPPVWTDRHL